jgi:hypothetical protein
MPDQAPKQVTMTQQQVDRLRQRTMLAVVRAVRVVGAAKVLAACAGLAEPNAPMEDILHRLHDLARTEGAYAAAVGRADMSAELRTACYLYGFAVARLVAAVTSEQLVLPADVAQGLSVVQQWVQGLVPLPGQ